MLVGPTAIAFIDGDAAAVAKVLRDYARTNPLLVIKGGVLGDKVIDARETSALADLPPRDVLLARFAGALAAPMQQMAGLLQALPRNFAYGLAALRDQRAESEPVAAEAEPVAAEAEAPAAEAAEAETADAETAEATAPDAADSEESPGETSTESTPSAEQPQE
jgi:large subunit ribosomal protein L10